MTVEAGNVDRDHGREIYYQPGIKSLLILFVIMNRKRVSVAVHEALRQAEWLSLCDSVMRYSVSLEPGEQGEL